MHIRMLRSSWATALTMALVMGWTGLGSAAPIVSARNSSDPQGRAFDGKLYLYTSSDMNKEGSWPMEKTYCYSLTDSNADPGLAASWTDNGAVLDESAYAWATQTDHLWAPDAFRGKDGKFYLYVPDVYNSAKDSRVGVAVSSSPTGPFAPPSGLTSSTNYIPNGSSYMSDPSVFEDPNDASGQRYLVYADGGFDTCGHISIAKLDQSTSAISGSQKIQWANEGSIPKVGSCTPAYMEGPQLSYFGGKGMDGNGKYFLYFAMKDNGSYTESIAYATADTPMGQYTYQGIIMSGQGGTGWTNQASIVEWQGHYLFFYHNDPKNQTFPNRQVFLECVGIKDGKIGSVTRGSYTKLSDCPKATTGMSGTGGTSSGGSGGGAGTSTGGAAGSSVSGGASTSLGGRSGTSTGGTPSAGATAGFPSTGGSAARSGSNTGASAGISGAGSTTGVAATGGGGTSAGSTGGATAGTTPRGSSGTSNVGGATGAGTSGTSGAVPHSDSSSDGCSCHVPATTTNTGSTRTFGVLALGMLALARRRRR